MRDYKTYQMTEDQALTFDTKYFINNLKLLFSSLFARQMTQIVIGCPVYGERDDVFIFTNVPYDDIEIYESDPEKYFHEVTVKDRQLLDQLYLLFPVLKECTLLFDSRLFMSGFNKSTKNILDAKLYLSGQGLIFECGEISVTCGRLLSAFMADQYHKIFQTGLPPEEDPILIGLDGDELKDKSTITYIPIKVEDKQCKWIYAHGRTTISLKEYLKKADPTGYGLTIRGSTSQIAMRISAAFTCQWVSVISTNPGMLYYIR